MNKVKLTYEQAEMALRALSQFNPPISINGKIAIARNLTKLKEISSEREHLRAMLVFESIEDKNKKLDGNLNAVLTPKEQLVFQPKWKELLKTQVEVDFWPLYIFDSSEGAPKNPPLAVDISKWPLPTELLEPLLDILIVDNPSV